MTEYSNKTASSGMYGAIAQIRTSKALFFAAAGISFCLSVWLWFSGDRERGLFVGAMVTFLSVAGAYVAIRRRANESPVGSYDSPREHQPMPPSPASCSVAGR